MTEQVRYRIDSALVKKAKEVCDELGITPTQAVSMLFAQLVNQRGLPFRPSEFPALEEYGVTLAEAEAAEADALKEIQADRKAGKVMKFAGKLFP
jgi:addiction module RelB/DinJ family antitoxin